MPANPHSPPRVPALVGVAEMALEAPLFIVGCVRSGTTLMRDLLRRHPGLICPEETHFFRWAEPFRTPHSLGPLKGNRVLATHRRIDGVDEATYLQVLATSRSRGELQRRYIAAFAAARGLAAYRWFDKTPQNVYGVNLIAQEYSKALFLHLVRNPLNVVASMKRGAVVNVPDIHGACNYWLEAVLMMRSFQAGHGDRVLQMRYEDVIADVPAGLAQVLGFIGLDLSPGLYRPTDARPDPNRWRDVLSAADVRVVRNRLGWHARQLGYDLEAALDEVAA